MPGYTEAQDRRGEPIYIGPQGASIDCQVEAAKATENERGSFDLHITFTDDATEGVKGFAGAHQGELAAFIIDGKVVSSAIIVGTFGKRAKITGTFGRNEAERIVNTLRAR